MGFFEAFSVKSGVRFFLVVLLGWVVATGGALAQSVADAASPSLGLSSYRLSAGDVITVRVLGEEDLSKEKQRLTDAGTISMPALGELRVMGKTTGEVERLVADGLRGRYLVNPRVSVTMDEYRPFYINGMVEKPGGYPFQPGLTVRKAAALAGGFRERASLRKIFIIRESDASNEPIRAELDGEVLPGDIVTVEESFF